MGVPTMTPTPPEKTGNAASSTTARRLVWASAAFYILIAFEFFYMASPFAAYFYAVYGPGMDGLERLGLTGWTLWFFLPHLVAETRSPLVNHAEAVGIVLFLGGIAAFVIGAVQVYRAKLRRADAVMGGLYRHIRHPQYAALIVASLGMLLIWPRFLVLFSTFVVIFAYVLLARAEEAICLRQYPGYRAYMAKTGMFVPRPIALIPQIAIARPVLRVAVWAVAFLGLLVIATAGAFALRSFAIGSLYSFRTADGVYVSVARISEASLADAARIARAAPAAQDALAAVVGSGRMIAYVLPAEMYVSEIPMHLPPGETFGHSLPLNADPDLWKVIFTEAQFGAAGLPPGADPLAHAVNKRPLAEVHVDLRRSAVTASFPPPAEAFYDGRQVPLF